jgi:hypothetical protein
MLRLEWWFLTKVLGLKPTTDGSAAPTLNEASSSVTESPAPSVVSPEIESERQVVVGSLPAQQKPRPRASSQRAPDTEVALREWNKSCRLAEAAYIDLCEPLLSANRTLLAEYFKRHYNTVAIFLRIAHRSMSQRDDYGDEDQSGVPGEIERCITKLVEREPLPEL